MVDSLVRLKSFLVDFADELFFTPNNIPVIGFGSFIRFLFKTLSYAVCEVSLELDLGSYLSNCYISE